MRRSPTWWWGQEQLWTGQGLGSAKCTPITCREDFKWLRISQWFWANDQLKSYTTRDHKSSILASTMIFFLLNLSHWQQKTVYGACDKYWAQPPDSVNGGFITASNYLPCGTCVKVTRWRTYLHSVFESTLSWILTLICGWQRNKEYRVTRQDVAQKMEGN